MPDINLAWNWAVKTCDAPKVGYSQAYRNEQTVGGITYYDCSSFIWYALKAGLFPIEEAYLKTMGFPYTTNAIVTAYERDWLTNLGFTQVDIQGEWKPGDICWRSGHTEMVYEGGIAQGRTMGAHTANTALASQVSINAAATPASKWSSIWRYGDGGSGTTPSKWIKGNRQLSLSEMSNNAVLVDKFLTPRGWSKQAIAGLLGNMQTESWINPGVWQNLNPTNPDLGYGLVQWTPSTKITDWLTAGGYELDDGDAQLLWIDSETVPRGQWNTSTQYPLSFEAFKISQETPEYLAYAFMYNFEQPGDLNQPARQRQARYWYEYLAGDIPPTPVEPNPPGPGVIDSQKAMPLWMLLRHPQY